jgi:hypothetical protein
VKILIIGLAIVMLLILALPLVFYFQTRLANPGVVRELTDDPYGDRAAKIMLLSLPSGREIPVNYLREQGRVYAGADGRWWKELEGEAAMVSVLVRGERLEGRARAVRDDPAYTKDVFARLRPTAIPGFGTLVEILLDPNDPGGPRRSSARPQ